MKTRNAAALILALCLIFCQVSPASAAPMRDVQQADVLLQDAGLISLLETVLGGAVLQNVNALEAGAVPGQALAESALALGIAHLALPYTEEVWQGQAPLSLTSAAAMLDMLFTTGGIAFEQEITCPGVTQSDAGLTFDFSALEGSPNVGVYAYAAQDQDGEAVTVLCDLYTYFGEFGSSAELLPEDAMTWLCNAQVSLRRAPEAGFGYTVNGFTLSDTYMDGQLAAWETIENTEFEYSLNLPAAILGLADETPRCMVWQSAEGDATLTVEAFDQTGETWESAFNSALDEFRQQHQGETVTEEMDFARFTAVGDGLYILCVVPAEMNWSYRITLEFPPERQAEYLLYAEFIRNSFQPWGAANG